MSVTLRATQSGQAMDFADPNTYNYTVKEIEQSLKGINRFNGIGVSVAKHSVVVAHVLYHLTNNPHIALRGLLHDAQEAYIGDMPTPLKHFLGTQWDVLEGKVSDAIYAQLAPRNQYNLAVCPLIKTIDTVLLKCELELLVKHKDYQLGEHKLWDFLNKFELSDNYKQIIHKLLNECTDDLMAMFNYFNALCQKSGSEYKEVKILTLSGFIPVMVCKDLIETELGNYINVK